MSDSTATRAVRIVIVFQNLVIINLTYLWSVLHATTRPSPWSYFPS